MACHAIDRPRADGEGTIDALRSWDPRVAGEERVGRGTPLGNPFTVIGSGSADEAVAAYWELLKGERSAHEIGRERGSPRPREPGSCIARAAYGGAEAPGGSCPVWGGRDREVPVHTRYMPRVYGTRVGEARGRSARPVCSVDRSYIVMGSHMCEFHNPRRKTLKRVTENK